MMNNIYVANLLGIPDSDITRNDLSVLSIGDHVPGGGVVPAGGAALLGAVVMTPGCTEVGGTDGGAPKQHVQFSSFTYSHTIAYVAKES